MCGNVSEVRVSSLLQACYRSCQALPRVYEQYRDTPIQPLSTEMQVLLTVYYLVQLGGSQLTTVLKYAIQIYKEYILSHFQMYFIH